MERSNNALKVQKNEGKRKL